jgi:AraC-like DNA-binding protein
MGGRAVDLSPRRGLGVVRLHADLHEKQRRLLSAVIDRASVVRMWSESSAGSDSFETWVAYCRIYAIGGAGPIAEQLGGSVAASRSENRPLASQPSELVDTCAWDARRATDALIELASTVPSGLSPVQAETARLLLDAAWRQLLGRLVTAREGSGSGPSSTPPCDARVGRALAELDRRYSDVRFTLRVLARGLGVSDCRLTQMLKRATGRTFGAHLHDRRVAHARALLADGSLSVKEVAARVGYSTTTQLDRHFKKRVGSLPSTDRAKLAAGDASALPRARSDTAQHNR